MTINPIWKRTFFPNNALGKLPGFWLTGFIRTDGFLGVTA
jgi:hypothetical protein